MPDLLNNAEFKRLLLSWPAKAIQYLYTFHRDSLLRILQNQIHSRNAAEDIIQDTFVDLWERHLAVGKKSDLVIGPYLSAAVRNKSADLYKDTARRNECGLDDNIMCEPEIGLKAGDVDTLWNLIASLPPREKQCIVMKYFQHMSYEAMAEELRITVKAVERNLTSARKRLRKFKFMFN